VGSGSKCDLDQSHHRCARTECRLGDKEVDGMSGGRA
jgi:hypothetical protein